MLVVLIKVLVKTLPNFYAQHKNPIKLPHTCASFSNILCVSSIDEPLQPGSRNPAVFVKVIILIKFFNEPSFFRASMNFRRQRTRVPKKLSLSIFRVPNPLTSK